MAIEDFGGSVLGKPIELVFADHRNDRGFGMSIARRWYGEGVDALADVGNSAVALAVASFKTASVSPACSSSSPMCTASVSKERRGC